MNIEKEYTAVFRYCLYHLGNREDAEDAVQEAYLRYLQHPEYHRSGSQRQYLYKIAKNICIDQLRRTKDDPLPDTPLPSPGQSVPEHVELKLALSELSDEDREIIILRLVNGETLGVLAELFGTSRFTMGRRVRRIIRHLKNKLGKEI